MRRGHINAVSVQVAFALVVLGCRGSDTKSFDTAEAANARYGAPTLGAAGGDVAHAGPMRVRVADITGNPERFIGKTVTVEADVDEVLSPFAFELDEDSPVAGGIDNDLNVAYPRSLKLLPLDNKWLNNKVRVTGTVRRLTVSELERDLGWDLTPKLKVELTHQPLLIAKSVERVGRP
jgi:hypothetical protein